MKKKKTKPNRHITKESLLPFAIHYIIVPKMHYDLIAPKSIGLNMMNCDIIVSVSSINVVTATTSKLIYLTIDMTIEMTQFPVHHSKQYYTKTLLSINNFKHKFIYLTRIWLSFCFSVARFLAYCVHSLIDYAINSISYDRVISLVSDRSIYPATTIFVDWLNSLYGTEKEGKEGEKNTRKMIS